MQKLFTKGNIINAVIIIALLLIVFVPAAKALLIRGLMGVGFYKADVTENALPVAVANELAFKDAAGKTILLSQLKNKVVMLNFWATWCPPCIAEMPSIDRLHQTLKADTNVVFIMVDADSDLKNAGLFIAKHGYNLPLYEIAGNVPESIYNGTLPTTLIFNKGGERVFRHEGMANYNSDEVQNFLKKLAAANN